MQVREEALATLWLSVSVIYCEIEHEFRAQE